MWLNDFFTLIADVSLPPALSTVLSRNDVWMPRSTGDQSIHKLINVSALQPTWDSFFRSGGDQLSLLAVISARFCKRIDVRADVDFGSLNPLFCLWHMLS